MKGKKLQVFVSSTYTDLIEERQAAVEAILSAGHIPAGMELFSAGDESQMAVIKRWIDESDIYLLILGGRYGSIENVSGKSYTHLEYLYALEQKKAMFSVVITHDALNLKAKTMGLGATDSNGKELAVFRNEVTTRLVKFWDDKKDIKLAVHETLSDFSYREELIGWIRGDQGVNGGLLAEEIARLTKENSELHRKLEDSAFREPTQLYAGLTYDQMLTMIDDSETDLGVEISIFDFIMENGRDLVDGLFFSGDEPWGKVLLELRLGHHSSLQSTIKFTDEGHLFYLKSLHMLRNE